MLKRNGLFGNMRNNIAPRSQGGGEDVPLGMGFGVFGTHDAAFDQAAHIRMVAGEAGDAFAANQVKTAIADMGKVELAADDRQSRTSRSHALKFRMLEGIALDHLMSGLQSGDQGSLGVASEIAIVNMTHGFHRETAGFLAAFVSAHAVGDGSETAFAAEIIVRIGLPVKERVFIIAALQADIGKARGLNSALRSFAVNRHNWESSSWFCPWKKLCAMSYHRNRQVVVQFSLLAAHCSLLDPPTEL